MLADVDGRILGNDSDSGNDHADHWELRGWQHHLRQEMAGQAEVMNLIESDSRAAHGEAARARAGVPEDVWASQAQALRQFKDQSLAARTGELATKRQSRLSPVAHSPPHMPEAAGVRPSGEWWRAEGPHCDNLFKWHAVKARAQSAD